MSSSSSPSKPILYHAPFSPPSRACRLTAKLIGLDLDLKFVDFSKRQHLSDEFLKLNPQHQIPVLIDTDGEVYVDSHAIVCFMIAKYAKDDKLYPCELKIRAQIDARLHFDSGILFPIVKDIAARNFYNREIEFHASTLRACHAAYGVLETFLQNTDFMVGNRLTVADVSINTTLLSLHLLIPIDEKSYPRTYAWLERMKSILPDYKEINLSGAERMCSRIIAKMEEHRANAAKK